MTYPRHPAQQARVLGDWQARVREAGLAAKPVMQPLYVDLADDTDTVPIPIHLGFRTGTRHLRDHLRVLEEIGVHHVALNLRFNRADIDATLERLSAEVLPEFGD